MAKKNSPNFYISSFNKVYFISMKNLLQISKETGIPRQTLLARAKILKIIKVGTQYIINEEDEKRLLDPALHKVGKRARVKKED